MTSRSARRIASDKRREERKAFEVRRKAREDDYKPGETEPVADWEGEQER